MKLADDEQAAAFVRQYGLSEENWRQSLRDGTATARMRETDARFETLVARASLEERRVMEGTLDPILLIEGRTLLLGGCGFRAKDVFQVANWVLRNELERRKEMTEGVGTE